MTLLCFFALALGINILMFFPAFYLKTDKLTDSSYCLTFVVVSLAAFLNSEITLGSSIMLGMIWLWAFRLGLYLLMRIRKIGHDSRFNEMRAHFGKFLGFWILQGFTVGIVLIPSLLYFKNLNHRISWLNFVGAVLWGLGLSIEALADRQKNRFYAVAINRGKWLDTGLWHYSRHPNYFGEILVWLGIYVFSLASLDLWQSLLGFLSPLYISVLLIFVSGIPILEKSAEKKFGQNPAYRSYKENTNLLIIWFSGKK
jgi:steroid 5-alpha reductase family enzyme